MRLNRISFIAVCLVPAFAFAQPPSRGEPRQPPRERDQRDARGGPPSQRPWERRHEDQADWPEVDKFFQDHAPFRWQKFKELPEDQRQKLRGPMIMHYRSVQWMLRDGNEELREIKIQQIRTEDDIFKNKYYLKDESPSPGEADKIKAELLANVRKLTDLRLKEREHRLKWMKTVLEQESERLQSDRENFDALVAKAYDDELAGRTEPGQGGPGGPGGPAGPGGPGGQRRGPEPAAPRP